MVLEHPVYWVTKSHVGDSSELHQSHSSLCGVWAPDVGWLAGYHMVLRDLKLPSSLSHMSDMYDHGPNAVRARWTTAT